MWAATAGGLKEIRDQRELAVLARVLGLLNQEKLPEAADVLTQRVRELLAAKRPGGTWEKGELLSLMPTAQSVSAVLPDGGMTL